MIAFGTWTTIFNRKLKPFWLKSPLLLLERYPVQIDNLVRLPERLYPRMSHLQHAQSMMTTSPFQYTQMMTTASFPPRSCIVYYLDCSSACDTKLRLETR